jgi:hypothetical protein
MPLLINPNTRIFYSPAIFPIYPHISLNLITFLFFFFFFDLFRFLQPEAGPLTKELMEDATFGDLAVRIGTPYLYVHQGDCQHIITITDIRLLNKYAKRERGGEGEGKGEEEWR